MYCYFASQNKKMIKNLFMILQLQILSCNPDDV